MKSVGKKETNGGRPPKPEEVRKLVVQIAKDNGWGLGRIMGKLKKLGLGPRKPGMGCYYVALANVRVKAHYLTHSSAVFVSPLAR